MLAWAAVAESPIASLFETDGTTALVRSLAAALQDGLAAQLEEAHEPVRLAAQEAAREAFAADELQRELLVAVSQDGAFDPSPALRWYRTPLGRKLLQAEAALAGGQLESQMATFAETLRRLPPRSERLALVDRILTVRRDHVVPLEALRVTTAATLLVMGSSSAAARAEEEGRVLAELAPALRQAARVRALFVCRSLTREELEELARGLEEVAVRAYFTRRAEAMASVLEQRLAVFRFLVRPGEGTIGAD